jgi:aryl-alcohol dehydrogenase-like predicted oxidoreductase
MTDLALRFILSNPDIGVVIPGMRRPAHVRANVATSDSERLDSKMLAALRPHRWDRTPTTWSQ